MKENFFIIDSEMLEHVQPKMYGMAFDSKSFITDVSAFDETAYREYSGAFVAIKKTGDTIRIYQDANGTHGIYLYEDDSYFALSNSFMLLFEYLHFRKKKKLDLHYGYACHLLTIPMCSLAYTSTLCRQIRILPRSVEATIQLEKKALSTAALPVSPKVDIYSEEALAIIDRWISKWASLIQNLQAEDLFAEVDVTGGMDSRLTLALALAADVDREKINFYSAEKYHISDDYPLARALAAACGFTLNAGKCGGKYTPLTATDAWNLSVLTNLGIHHYPYYKNSAYSPSIFKFTGQGGETIRNHWYVEPHALERAMIGGDISQRNLSLSAVKFLWEELIALNQSRPAGHADGYRKLVHHLYDEGRARYHFGRNIMSWFMVNYMTLAPLLDPELRRVDCLSQGNLDHDLLMAVIMMRIDKRLVEIPFNDGKMFSADCISRAREINRKGTLRVESESVAIPRNVMTYVPDGSADETQEPPLERLKRLVLEADVRNPICEAFGTEVYDDSIEGFDRPGVHPEKDAFKVLAVARIANPAEPVLMGFDALAGVAGKP